ncbi:MAG: substrate-binding domain-containing protein [Dysgonamonadaceae bacterium]|jgi:phosphate transport system substrate-binding protein|nr:substrate-binding domain-containing protein [Dysgonamonadaceae bacterium]
MKDILKLFGVGPAVRICLLTVPCFFFACRKTLHDSDTLTGGLIHVSSSDEFRYFLDAEIDAFCMQYDSAHIIPRYGTEKDAIRLLVEDSVRFAIATRGPTEREAYLLSTKNLTVHKSVIAFDGVALVTGTVDSLLSLSTIRKILRGDITDWSEVNPDNHAGAIRILFDNQHSGVFRYLIDSLLEGNVGKISPNFYSVGTAAEVIEKTSTHSGALGFVAFGYIAGVRGKFDDREVGNLRLVRVSKEDVATIENSGLPYAGDLLSGRYPLWRSVYVLVSDPKAGLPTGFAVFIANQVGQKVIQKAGLLPITDAWNIPVEIIEEFGN